MSDKKLFLKKLIVVLVSLLVLTGMLFVAGRANPEVEFEDPGLEYAVRRKLEKWGGPLYQSELSDIISLDASNCEISSLNGIERIHRLAELNLENNFVEDLSPLSKLKMIKTLNLNGNGITDLEERLKPLARVPLRVLKLRNNFETTPEGETVKLADISCLQRFITLEELDLRDNAVEDITPLEKLNSLIKLNIRGNKVKSLQSLSSLKTLTYLNIHSNVEIDSIVPLKDLHRLETLIMRRVPIDDINVIKGFKKLQNLNVLDCDLDNIDLSVFLEMRRNGALTGVVKPAYLVYALAAPGFSQEGGFYEKGFELKLAADEADADIYYTTDGSEPTAKSSRYSANNPVAVKDEGVTVVSARVISKDNTEMSEVVAHSYFVGVENAANLPVISLVTDSKNLFDEATGIYHEANMYNRGSEWERPVFFEFFENDGKRAFGVNGGLRIHGGSTRKFDQKSLRIYTDGKYNKDGFVNYDIFGDLKKVGTDKTKTGFSRLLLRNSGNDWELTMFRDAFIQRLIASIGTVDTQAYRPAVVYINGEYWGILNIRERYDEYYFRDTYGVDIRKIAILEDNAKLSRGMAEDVTQYKNMIAFIEANSLADDKNFAEIKKQMDVENYRDYVIANTFISNSDWPGNNVKFWRYRADEYREDAEYALDGRWRWLIFDTDYGFNLYRYQEDRLGNCRDHAHNTISWIMAPEDGLYGEVWPNFLFRALMENEGFRTDFLIRYSDLLNTCFETDHVLSVMEQMQKAIEPEMPNHTARWGGIKDMKAWYGNIGAMKEFAVERPGYIRKYLIEEFNLKGIYRLNLGMSQAGGYVKVNSIDVDRSGWKGVYFKNLPLTMTAIPAEGYVFSHWEGLPADSKEKTVTLNPAGNLTVKAVFKAAE